MCITSPSCTTYSLPSRRSVPLARAAASEPAASSASQRMVSARMKWCSRSEWIAPAACGALEPTRNRPGAALVLAGGEEADQPQQLVALADQPHQAALVQPVAGQELRGLLVVHLRQLGLHLAADGRGAGVGPARNLVQLEAAYRASRSSPSVVLSPILSA